MHHRVGGAPQRIPWTYPGLSLSGPINQIRRKIEIASIKSNNPP